MCQGEAGILTELLPVIRQLKKSESLRNNSIGVLGQWSSRLRHSRDGLRRLNWSVVKKTPDRKLLPGVWILLAAALIRVDGNLYRWWVRLF